MAVTDDQMDSLKDFAYHLGKDQDIVGVDSSDDTILSAVFDMAAEHGMKTEDEFEAPLTLDDLPAVEDHRDILDAYACGTHDAEND